MKQTYQKDQPACAKSHNKHKWPIGLDTLIIQMPVIIGENTFQNRLYNSIHFCKIPQDLKVRLQE